MMLKIPGYLFVILMSGCLNANAKNQCKHGISHLVEIKNNGCACVSDTHQNLQQQCDVQNSSLVVWKKGGIAELKDCVQIDCHGKKKAVCCVKKVVNKTWFLGCKIDGKVSDCNRIKIVCENTVESRDVKKTTTVKSRDVKKTTTVESRDVKKTTTVESRDVKKTTKTTYLSTKEIQKQTKQISQYQETMAANDTTKYTREIITLNKLEQTTEDASYTITRDATSLLKTDVKNPNAMVAIYCLSVLVIVLSLLVLFLLYLRCRHQKRQSLKKMSSVPNNDQTENMAKNTGGYELADNSKLEAMEGDTKVPATGTKEDVYNHLWEKPAEKENVYNKCTLERNETSVYDVTGGPQCISATVNANYDHVTLGNANLDTPI